MLTTLDEMMRDLADRAADQCEALANKLTAVIDGEDETETLRGIAKDKDRAGLIFAEHDGNGARTWIYVDAILALAKLINGTPEAKE